MVIAPGEFLADQTLQVIKEIEKGNALSGKTGKLG